MGFLAPLFLGAVTLVGLPVWLHLLRQHKTTPVTMPSLMFFERRTTTSTRQRKLRYYALLAMRLLAILLLVLAFAQPYWERTIAAGSGKRMTVAAIDNSFSMRRANSVDSAKQQALGLAAKVSAAEPGIVVAFGSGAREVGQKAEDASVFRNNVNAVVAGDERTSYAELSRVLRGLHEAHKMPLDIHVYTDVQRSGMPARFADLQLPADAKLEIHDVAPKELPNFAVEAVTPPGRIFDTKAARVRATIAGIHTPRASKVVSLVADGKVLATKPVEIAENGRTSVEFTGLDTGYGFHRGEIRIDGADNFPNDDTFRFAIERSDPRRVLYLHASRDAKSALYVKAALDAAVPNAYSIEAAPYETTSTPNLTNVSFVVLADPGGLPSALEASLKDYVQKGGAVFIAAGPFTGAQSKLPVSGLTVKESRLTNRTREMFQTVASKEPLHPVIEKAAGLESVKFYQVVTVEPNASTKVLAKTADAVPVVLDQALGEGRVLILTSPLDNLGNNLPLHPAFIPFVERTAQYLSRQQESTGIVAVGEGVELRAATDRAIGVEVLDPRGDRALTLEQAAKATSFAPGGEGYYEIRRANGRSSLVAVNADRRESDFARMEDETVSLWKATGEPSEGQKVNASGERTERVSPWWWLLLVVLLLTLAEGVLASRYLYGSGAGEQAQAELVGKEVA
ncbi:MAG: BatA domain-containing protein [Acidobacteria bacterium]|nr:BatA domain-containing protein [Acidobacteriota bacterium]